MLSVRLMPCLLASRGALVKTVSFRDPRYVGDPANAVRIFNEKEVDELVIFDIDATSENRGIDWQMLESVVSECFMPICYGGGVTTLDHMARLFAMGVEKVSLSSAAVEDPGLVERAAAEFGTQAVVVTLDVKKGFLGRYAVRTHRGRHDTKRSVTEVARTMADAGAGEIIVNSIDRDGTWSGFDLDLVKSVTAEVGVPVVCVGGAGSLEDIRAAVKQGGASAVAIGSMAVFQGKDLGVLIKFPSRAQQEALFA